MLALQKLIKVGAYYQHGHKLLTSTIKSFQFELSMLAGDNSGVCFQFEDDVLLLESCSLPDKIPFVQEFQTLLTDLGIIRLEIRKDIQANDVQGFFQSLLTNQFKLKSSQGFRQIPHISPVPSSITVVQQQFLVSDYELGAHPEGPRGQATTALLLDKLYKKGVSEEQLMRCRSILKELSLESVASPEVKAHSSSLFVSWEDVEQLLLRATTVSQQKPGAISQASQPDSIADLAAILNHLEDEDTKQQSQSSIDFLLRQIKKLYDNSTSEGQQRPSTATGPQRENIAAGAITDITNFLAENPLSYSLREKLCDRSHLEDISILLQMMKLDRASNHTEALQKYFQDILLDFSRANEWQLFMEGMFDIATHCGQERLSDIMQIVVTSLRMTTPVSNLPMTSHLPPYSNLLFFRDLLGKCDQHGLRRIWPFALNEVIQFGGGDSPETLNQIFSYLSALPLPEQEGMLPLLQTLDSFQRQILAADLFVSVAPGNYPILALLISTSLKDTAFDRIFAEFQKKPPDWLIRSVLPFLHRQTAIHQDFLVAYLRQGQINRPSKVLSMMAGRIILDGLRKLPEDQRKEPFVASAIKTLPLFPNPDSAAFLQEIAHTRKMLLLSSWPLSCRQAAQEALAQAQRTVSQTR